MCDICSKQMIEQGILESDLQRIPFKEMKWQCIVPGCRGGGKIRDYGMDPFYFDPCIIRMRAGKVVRGGWWDMTHHYYFCSRHWKDHERISKMMEHRFSMEYFLSKIKPFGIKKVK